MEREARRAPPWQKLRRGRRQRLDDLLAMCAEDVVQLERGAALEVAASEHAVRCLLNSRLSLPGLLVGGLKGRGCDAEAAEVAEVAEVAEARQPGEVGGSSEAAHAATAAAESEGREDGVAVPPAACAAAELAGAAPGVAERRHPEAALASHPEQGQFLPPLRQHSPPRPSQRQQPPGAMGPGATEAAEALESKAEPRDVTCLHTDAALRKHCVAAPSQILQALVRDNTVLECNLHDYATALRTATQEVSLLQTQIAQLESACGQVDQLQDLLRQERNCSELSRVEKSRLQGRSQELMTVIQEAAAAVDDDQSMAIIRGLIAENCMLRELLFVQPSRACLSDGPPQTAEPPHVPVS